MPPNRIQTHLLLVKILKLHREGYNVTVSVHRVVSLYEVIHPETIPALRQVNLPRMRTPWGPVCHVH